MRSLSIPTFYFHAVNRQNYDRNDRNGAYQQLRRSKIKAAFLLTRARGGFGRVLHFGTLRSLKCVFQNANKEAVKAVTRALWKTLKNDKDLRV